MWSDNSNANKKEIKKRSKRRRDTKVKKKKKLFPKKNVLQEMISALPKMGLTR